MMGKKAQAWGIDLMIAVIIFAAGILIFFVYTLNSSRQESALENLRYEGSVVSSVLLSPGSPAGWNESNVISIGIADNGKINETKLASFYAISVSDYQKSKSLLSTKYDYYFLLNENMTINGKEVEGIGKKPSGSESNLASTTRFIIYKDNPATAYIYISEE